MLITRAVSGSTPCLLARSTDVPAKAEAFTICCINPPLPSIPHLKLDRSLYFHPSMHKKISHRHELLQTCEADMKRRFLTAKNRASAHNLKLHLICQKVHS